MTRSDRRGRGSGRAALAVMAVGIVIGVGGCVDSPATDTAVQRGDLAYAAGDLDNALAEYRLAARDTRAPAEVLARVAHVHAIEGDVDEAAAFYRRAVAADSSWATQAVADLMTLAERAHASNDRFRMASAVDAAREIEPGLGLERLALPLARHHFNNGEYGRALPLYQRALSAGADSAPEIVFEIGRAHEAIGDCNRALFFFEQFRGAVRSRDRGEVDWFIGTCSFEVARGLRGAEVVTEETLLDALAAVDRTIAVGEPRSLLGRAWFERGEILVDLGRCEEAIESFRTVGTVDGTVADALVTRAQERMDDLRFRSDVMRRDVPGRGLPWGDETRRLDRDGC
ncbi:MAG: tetratricopeptide repeat protein [Longimicrobiales bacterium]|nr:tetratricopeptide repeat protein [Longimicrobiales bacterium]